MAEARRPVQFIDLLRELTERKVDFIVVGGVAAVLEGVPVSTFDLDVVYDNTEANTERLAAALEDLQAICADPTGREIRPDVERLRLGGHHLFRTRAGRLDVLDTVGADLAFGDLLDQCTEKTIHGMQVLVLSLKTLIATKEAANRAKDRAVLDLLRETLALKNERSDG